MKTQDQIQEFLDAVCHKVAQGVSLTPETTLIIKTLTRVLGSGATEDVIPEIIRQYRDDKATLSSFKAYPPALRALLK